MLKSNKPTDENGLVSGALALTVSVFIVKIIGYLYKLPLSHILGDEGMGYFNSAYSVFTFFYMLSLGGVPRAVAICVSESRVKYGNYAAQKILNISLAIFLSIGIVFAAALMIFSSFFASAIGNSTAKLSLFCIAPSLAFVSAGGVLRGYLNGIGRVSDVAVAEVLDGVSKFVTGLFLALYSSRKKMSVSVVSAYTILGVSIGAFIGATFMCIRSKTRKTNENIRQNCEFFESGKEIIKKVFRISVPITLSSAILGATNIIDLGMIMRRLAGVGFSEAEAVALYGNFTTLVIPFLNLVSAFVTPLATASMPHLTKNKALGKDGEYYELIEQIICITAFFVFPIAFSYSFFSKDILSFLFSDESASTAAPLLILASPSVVFSALLIMSNTVLEASGYAKAPLIAMSGGAIVKLISGYLIIGKAGISGAPISTSLCYFVAFLISFGILRKKIPYKNSIVKSCVLPFLLSSTIILLGCLGYNLLTNGEFNSVKFIGTSFVISLIYSGLTLIFIGKRVKKLTNYVKIAKK